MRALACVLPRLCTCATVYTATCVCIALAVSILNDFETQIIQSELLSFPSLSLFLFLSFPRPSLCSVSTLALLFPSRDSTRCVFDESNETKLIRRRLTQIQFARIPNRKINTAILRRIRGESIYKCLRCGGLCRRVNESPFPTPNINETDEYYFDALIGFAWRNVYKPTDYRVVYTII